MSEKIQVLIVDDLPETRENVRKLLQFEPDIDVVGQAANGDEAVQMAQEHRPHVVLMDINMPGVDGIGASHTIARAVPESQVIIMSVQSEADYLRRAMLAGVRDFLMKPFSGDELVAAIRNVYATRPAPVAIVPEQTQSADERATYSRRPVRHGKVLTVFSPKGGIGCTTIAINVAVSLARQGYKTLLVDGSLQFGDVAVMLNLRSVTTIIDMIERISELDEEFIDNILISHESGLKVVLAPPRPEMAEFVKAEHFRTLLDKFREMFDYVVVDTSSGLTDTTLTLLDTADRIVLVAQQSLPSLKNASRFFDLSNELEYDREKVSLVINHASNRLRISVKDVVDTLKRPVVAVIPEDDAAQKAADQGTALVSGPWQRRPAVNALTQLTDQLILELDQRDDEEDLEVTAEPSKLARLFGGR